MSELEEFLETVIPLQEAADLAMHQGDPEPRFALWSHEDPVSVLGAAGGSSIGWAEVSETFRWVAAKFTGCESFRLEVVAAGVSGDIAYTAGFEHSMVSFGGGPMRAHDLRVSHAYRREGGEWKIAHRHGDDLVTSSASTG